MPKKKSYTVLMGDVDKSRIGLFREVLDEDFRSELIVRGDWSAFKEVLTSREDKIGQLKDLEIDLIIVSLDLPGDFERRLKLAVDDICRDFYGPLIAVKGANYKFTPPRNVHPFVWSGATSRDDVKNFLEPLLPKPDPLPGVTLSEPSDFLLNRQIRGLTKNDCLADGIKILATMIRDLDLQSQLEPPYESARISRLAQGYSGALVFKIEVQSGPSAAEYVLKVVHGQSNRSKLDREIRHLPTVYRTLDPHNLKAHVPALITPRAGAIKRQGLVESDGSYAVCYQFLGAKIGEFRDLESVYLGFDPGPSEATAVAPPRITDADPARMLVTDLIRVLRKAWYDPPGEGAPSQASRLQPRPLWIADDLPSPDSRQFPPYRLTAWEKAFTLGALGELDSFGQRLLGYEKWRDHVRLIEEWLQGEHPLLESLKEPRKVMVSCVHGDLNAKNVLLWTNEQRPFLIDFACFQPAGHALEDFARLEAEVKFALMDREHGVDDPALDHSPGRFPVWCFIERDLASLAWAEATIPLRGRERFVARALEIVKDIRKLAREVRRTASKDGMSEKKFLIEYGSGLLYHTVRAIGFNSLSPFKRLLAVFSAGRWIEFLGHCTSDRSD